MRLLRMVLQAVGPFPGRHTVDFAQLSSSGLFLLEGPTGSGKSTLIDAIVFALYGKVASEGASEDRLRSDHAGPDVESFVDLVFETGHGLFRVRRTPAYERPKQRGTGTRMQQATAKLWRLTSPDVLDDGDLLSTRPAEIGGELQRIVGLDRAQFVQTVVLPQGQFAGFLQAKPEDRRGLLQKVFGTEMYDRVERQLAAMRQEATRSLATARDGVGLAVASFLGASGLTGDDALAIQEVHADDTAPDADDRLTALVTQAADGIRTDAGAAREVATAAKAAGDATRRLLEGARRVVEVLRRRDGLLAEQSALDGRSAAHAENVLRLAAARRAQRVLPSVAGADQAAGAVRVAEASVRDARGTALAEHPELAGVVGVVGEVGLTGVAGVTGEVGLTGVVGVTGEVGLTGVSSDGSESGGVGPEPDTSAQPEPDASDQRDVLAAEREACAARRAGLARPLELEGQLVVRRQTVAKAATALDGLRTDRGTLVTELAALPERRAELRTRRDAAAVRADHLSSVDGEVAAAQRCHTAAEQAHGLDRDVEQATQAMQTAADVARQAASTVHGLHEARIAGIAAELAVDLAPGAPCPVCGATEHPHPAAPGPEQVTVDMIDAAELVRKRADKKMSDVADRLAKLQTRRDAARAETEGLDTDAASARLDAALAAARTARAGVRERDALDAELATFDHVTQQIGDRRRELDVEIAGAEARLADARRHVDEDAAEVTAALDGAASVRERAAVLDGWIRAVGAWVDALDALKQARVRRGERDDELDIALRDHQFDSVTAVRAATLPDGAIAVLDASVRDHDVARARVEAGLADFEVVDLPEDLATAVAAAQLVEAEQAHQDADAKATLAEGEAARLADRASSSARAVGEVGRAVAALVRAREQAGPVVRMANVVAGAGGDNAMQLSLGTYVLVRRFEDVIAAANTRLSVMSGGRYELARSDERERGGARKLGLAMKILDHTTELSRDPRTLSGGETFYVSLCLALGLADVVMAEAGGIDLGTLFIDEGFGTLDDEVLDTVLTVLGTLREGGRVVGVVSHVDALKQSIAERVEVRRAGDGTSTLVVHA